MENILKDIIISQGMAFDGEYYWLIENDTNWLARVSKDLRCGEYISEIPRRYDYGESSTCIIGAIYDNNIYCTPRNTNVMWKYNIDSGEFKSIELPIKDNQGLYIVSSWVVGNSMWLSSCKGKVWEVSLKDDSVKGGYPWHSKEGETILSTEFIMCDNQILGVNAVEGLLYRFDIATRRIITEDIEEKTGFGTICKHSKEVYLTDKSNSILVYNPYTKTKNRYKLFDSNIKSDKNIFIRSIVYKDIIILVPWMPNGLTNNNIILFDIKKKESVEIKVNNDDKGFCILGGFFEERLFFYYSNYKRLCIYDFKNNRLIETNYIIKNRTSRNKLLLDRSITNENITMDLNDFINILITI